MVEELERNKEYFWQSQKDGCFYSVKLNSINHQGNYNIYIDNIVEMGYLSPAPREKIGNIKTFHKKNLDVYDDFLELKVNYLLKVALTSDKYFDFQRTIELYFDLYDLLMEYPHLYIKHIDKLLRNKTFKKLLDGDYKRPMT